LLKNSVDLKEFVEYLNSLNVEVAQYRNKKRLGNIEQELKLIKKHFNGKLIINDYLEYIDLADGLHIGQEDLATISNNKKEAIKTLRNKIGKKLLGLSTHNLAEIQEANGLDLDYIGLGAYRVTATKDVDSIGGDKLLDIASFSIHKVAIIGGVRLDDEFKNFSQITYKVIGSDLIKEYSSS
jgi:thiamine-phosphate pyrophosphorylase